MATLHGARAVEEARQPLPDHGGGAQAGSSDISELLHRMPWTYWGWHGPRATVSLPAAAQLHAAARARYIRRDLILPDHEWDYRDRHAVLQTRVGIRKDLGCGQLRGCHVHRAE